MNRCLRPKEASVPYVDAIKDIKGLQSTTIIRLVKCGDCYVSHVIGVLDDFLIPNTDYNLPSIIFEMPSEPGMRL